jgi:quinol monooxygenase YgiN
MARSERGASLQRAATSERRRQLPRTPRVVFSLALAGVARWVELARISTLHSRLGLSQKYQQRDPLQYFNSLIGGNMATQDKCCTIVPYFKVPSGKLPAFKSLCEQFVAKSREESKCLYYGFSFNGDQAHCREGYADAEGALAHLANVGPLLDEALKMVELTRLEIHGPEEELAKLREPLAKLNPQFFTLEYGFRR